MAQRTVLKFDEIHKPIPYREFFGKMHISVAQMNKRIEIAESIENAMLFVFAYWLIHADLGMSEADMKKLTREQLKAVYEHYTRSDEYLEKRLDKLSDEIIDVTARHTAVNDESDDDDDTPAGYWTSINRAQIIAENEANAFENYNEYKQAKTRGYTKKRWLTELDDRVRTTHTLVEGKTVDIDGLFLVGDSYMRFPHDMEYDPDPNEVINCRCSCVYE